MSHATVDCHKWVAAAPQKMLCHTPTHCNGNGGGRNYGGNNQQQSYALMEELFALKAEVKSLKKKGKSHKCHHGDDNNSNDE